MCSAGTYLHENTTHDGMDSKHSNKSPVTLKTKFGAASSKSVACKSVQGSIQGDHTVTRLCLHPRYKIPAHVYDL